ncbi:hypothetical protein ACFVT8_04360 [Lysinibacillus sp. NPDC058147]|uniref:hypothetical protein n=1 Tax=unclassified Lysinibacillus TaxID=2636778 RepID=UPI0036D8AA40
MQVIPNSKSVVLYHIKGSSSYLINDRTKSYFPFNITYRVVKLEFILEDNNSSRWLTNSEIAQGIIDAIEQEIPEKHVGVFEPWSLRP